MAQGLIGSEIIKLGNEVNERIRAGEPIANFTIGDFNPAVFPIPARLLEEIIKAYQEGNTNYPMANGMPELRTAIAQWSLETYGLHYTPEEVLVAGGARPIIYGIYATLIDAGDKVIFPVPSWNNNHYCHLFGATPVMVECKPENNFMPVAAEIKPYLRDARLLALCSPQNPTGTMFGKEQLEAICDSVLEENARRKPSEKPLYILFDQIYGALVYGDNQHHDPVSLRPDLRPYTIYVDGISKSLAATGVRVGWALGPSFVIDKMKAIIGHIGAWSPKAEQVATARYLKDKEEMEAFAGHFKKELAKRLHTIYTGFEELRKEGFPVHCIQPAGAIYLTVQFNLKGRQTKQGKSLANTADVTRYILDEAKLAMVPFSAFGASADSTWYRLSVGACKLEELGPLFSRLKSALSNLK